MARKTLLLNFKIRNWLMLPTLPWPNGIQCSQERPLRYWWCSRISMEGLIEITSAPVENKYLTLVKE